SIPATVVGWIADIFTMNTYSDVATEGFLQAGENAGRALVEAIKAAVDSLISWFSSLPGRIAAAVGRIDIGSLIKWPSMPKWLGGGSSVSPALAGTRAAGGPVRAGLPYLVGERGPEIVTFARDAFVHSAAARRPHGAQRSPCIGCRDAGRGCHFN